MPGDGIRPLTDALEPRNAVTNKPTIRHCAAPGEFEACVQLQQATWGEGYHDCVPASLLKVSRRVGGIVAGAFDGDRMIGFVFGLTGPADAGRMVHWSHMLAVRDAYRDRGVGRALKMFQREALRGTGVDTIAWTFDPLVARNAHLNLNRLGASVTEYVPDMYAETGSGLHAFGTDRIVVSWPVVPSSSRERRAVSGPTAETPVANAAPGMTAGEWPRAAERIRIEVPADIEAIARDDLATARAWRESTKRAFLEAARRGFVVSGFVRNEAGCFYVLETAS